MKKITLLFLALIGCFSCIYAQGSISGTVTDENDEPLAGALVRLEPGDDAAITDSDGNYTFNDIGFGTYSVSVSFVGFDSASQSASVGSAAASIVNFNMTPAAGLLQGVVITAQKREQDIIDVPVSITAISSDFLNNTGITESSVLSDYVPGLQVQAQSVNNPSWAVRGITSDSDEPNIEPRVSVFVDGVSSSKAVGSVSELYDMERIEILKGPQGTLFGRGAQIGAVHLIQNKAENERTANLKIGTGNYSEKYASGHFNIPLTDHIYFRAAGFYQDRDGYQKNLAGGTINGKKTLAGRALFRNRTIR